MAICTRWASFVTWAMRSSYFVRAILILGIAILAVSLQSFRSFSLVTPLMCGGLLLGFAIVGGSALYVHRKAEKIKAIREGQFQSLLEQSADIAIRFDSKLRCIYASPSLQDISDNESKERLVQNNHILMPEPLATQLEPALLEVIATGIEKNLEAAWVATHGTQYCFQVFIFPEPDPDGKIVGLLAIGRDLLPLRRAEYQMEESRAALQQFLVHREEAREDERRRIAKDLHEELGQVLTALRLQLAMLRTSPAQAENKTQAMIEMVDGAIRGMRSVVNILRPSTLDIGIISALDWLSSQFSSHTGINCVTKFDDEKLIVLSDSRATKVFRIAQEALANAAKHANAKQVSLWLLREGDHLILQIADDGCGFDPLAKPSESFGLLGIRERAAMLGGTVDICSTPYQGTQVKVRFPIDGKP